MVDNGVTQRIGRGTYQIFSNNLKKMELKQNAQKGFILIGPSKNGKTTIFCSLTKSPLRVVKNPKGSLYYIEPQKQQQKELISEKPISITQHPNTRKFDKDIYIVDMPGHSDDQHFRKLCNFYYIKQMTLKLNKFYFLIVLTVHSTKLTLNEQNLGMLISFMQMFQQAKNCVSFLINKKPKKQNSLIIQSLKNQLKNFPHAKLYDYFVNTFDNKRFFFVQSATQQNSQFKCSQQLFNFVKNAPYKQKKDIKFGQIKFGIDDQMDRLIYTDGVQYCRQSSIILKNLTDCLYSLLIEFVKLAIGQVEQIKLDTFFNPNLIKDLDLDLQIAPSSLSKIPQVNQKIMASIYKQNTLNSQDIFLIANRFTVAFQSTLQFQDSILILDLDQKQKKQWILFQQFLLKLANIIKSMPNNLKLQIDNSKQNYTYQMYLDAIILSIIRKNKQISFLYDAVGSRQFRQQITPKTIFDFIQKPIQDNMQIISQFVIKINNQILYTQQNQHLIKDQYLQSRLLALNNIQKIIKRFQGMGTSKFPKNEYLNAVIADKFKEELYSKMKQYQFQLINIFPNQKFNETVIKLTRLLQYWKKLKQNKQKTKTENLSNLKAKSINLFGQLFEKASVNSIALKLYQNIGFTIKAKRCLKKIHSLSSFMSKQKECQFYIQQGDIFASYCDQQTAFWCYQIAKQKTFKNQKILQICQKQIILRNQENKKKINKQLISKYSNKVWDLEQQTVKNIQQTIKQFKGKIEKGQNKTLWFENIQQFSAIKSQILKLRYQLGE